MMKSTILLASLVCALVVTSNISADTAAAGKYATRETLPSAFAACTTAVSKSGWTLRSSDVSQGSIQAVRVFDSNEFSSLVIVVTQQGDQVVMDATFTRYDGFIGCCKPIDYATKFGKQLRSLLPDVTVEVTKDAKAQRVAPLRPPATGNAKSLPSVPSEPALTNEEVLKLVAADLGDEIVVAKIKSARVASLDVTTDTLLALKEKKVSKVVLAAMIERAGEPNRTPAAASPSSSAHAGPTAPMDPCAGVELMGLYKNEIFDRAMGGGVVEWLAKIRNNNAATRIVVFGWRDSEGQQRKAQVEVGGGQIVTPRVDMTQARYIAPVANLNILSCE